MENKALRGSVIALLVVMVLNECVNLFGHLAHILLAKYTEMDHSTLNNIFFGANDVTYLILEVMFVIVGIMLIRHANKRVPALLGGGLLTFVGAVSVLRVMMYYIFRWTEHYPEMVAMCHYGWFIGVAVLMSTAYILIAAYYNDKSMMGLAIVYTVLALLFQAANVCNRLQVLSFTAFTMIAGVVGLAIFIIALIYVIRWLKNTKI